MYIICLRHWNNYVRYIIVNVLFTIRYHITFNNSALLYKLCCYLFCKTVTCFLCYFVESAEIHKFLNIWSNRTKRLCTHKSVFNFNSFITGWTSICIYDSNTYLKSLVPIDNTCTTREKFCFGIKRKKQQQTFQLWYVSVCNTR